MPVVGAVTSQNYPTLEAILNLVRALANDAFAGTTGTPGEGQVLTDLYQGGTSYNAQLLSCFNSAIREMYRKLRNVKAKALIRDNYILTGLPIVNGPLGSGQPDPTVQTNLSFAGYFDGTVTTPSLTLPPDLLMPLRVWDRLTGTTDVFIPLQEARNGIDPSNQVDQMRIWEWREGQINFPGTTTGRDIRIKYLAFLPKFFPTNPVDSAYFSNSQIPIFDCEEAVAWLTLRNLCVGLNPAILAPLQTRADDAMFDLSNEEVRRMQATQYFRRGYDDNDTGQELDIYGI